MYLRHFNENDYLELTKYYMPNLKEEQFKQIIREWNLLKYKNKFFEIFAIVENRQIVGMISLYQHTSTVVSEGVEIFKPFRNKGLATKSILLIQNIAKFYGYKVFFLSELFNSTSMGSSSASYHIPLTFTFIIFVY